MARTAYSCQRLFLPMARKAYSCQRLFLPTPILANAYSCQRLFLPTPAAPAQACIHGKRDPSMVCRAFLKWYATRGCHFCSAPKQKNCAAQREPAAARLLGPRYALSRRISTEVRSIPAVTAGVRRLAKTPGDHAVCRKTPGVFEYPGACIPAHAP
jgi:hypothetical protein